MSDEQSSLDPGRVGDVRVDGPLINVAAGENMLRDVEPVPVGEAQTLRDRHLRRRKDGKGGRFVKKPGRQRKGELRAVVRSDMKWTFKKAIGLVGLRRDALQRLASYRDRLEQDIRTLHAGQPAGLYAWRNGVSAMRHEMRAQMMEQILEEYASGELKLTLEQQLLVIKHLCDASDNGDAALKRIGLDRLCQGQEEFDPWTAPIEGEASHGIQDAGPAGAVSGSDGGSSDSGASKNGVGEVPHDDSDGS